MSYSMQYLLSVKDSITPALQKIKSQLADLSRTQKSLQNIKPFAIKADASSAKSTIQSLKQELSELKSKTINIAATKTGTAASPMVGGGFGMAGIAGAAAGFIGVSAAIMGAKASLEAFMDVESAQLGLRKALDIDGAPLDVYKEKLRDLSSELGIAQEKIVSTAVSFAKADSSLNPEQLTRITKLNYAASIAWGVDAEAATDAMQVMQAIFNLKPDGLEDMANKIDMLGDKFGVLTESYLVDFMTVGAGIGKSMGLSQEQIMAFGVATGEAKIIASEAANMLKHLGSDVSSPKQEAIAAFEKLGLSWQAMQKLEVGDRIKQVLTALNQYKGLDKVDLAKDIIGQNYDDTLLRASVNSEKLSKALDLMKNSGDLTGRVMSNLGLQAETARGRLDRTVQSLRNVAIAGAGAIVELLAGDQISPIWADIGNNIAHVWNTLTGGAEGANTILSTLKFLFLGVAIGVQTVVTGLTQLFNILFGILDGIVKLVQGDFSGAWTALKTGFIEAGEAGTRYIDSVSKAMGEFDADAARRAASLQAQSPLSSAPTAIQDIAGASAATLAINAATAKNGGDPSAALQGQAAAQQLQAAQQMNSFGLQLGNAAQKIDDASKRMYDSGSVGIGLPAMNLGTQGR
jgi:TP901 family phage tail tape measure protein